MPSSRPKSPPPSTVTWGIRISADELGGGDTVHWAEKVGLLVMVQTEGAEAATEWVALGGEGRRGHTVEMQTATPLLRIRCWCDNTLRRRLATAGR